MTRPLAYAGLAVAGFLVLTANVVRLQIANRIREDLDSAQGSSGWFPLRISLPEHKRLFPASPLRRQLRIANGTAWFALALGIISAMYL